MNRAENDDLERVANARKHVHEAVTEAGVHVLVLRRQPKQATTNYWQVSLLARHFRPYTKLFRNCVSATLGSMTRRRRAIHDARRHPDIDAINPRAAERLG